VADGDAVRAEPDVDLDAMCATTQGALDRGQGVLRGRVW